MKNKLLLSTVFLILNIILTFAVDFFTFKYRPGHGISGNGNPGIIVLVLGFASLFLLMIYITMLTRDYYQKYPDKIFNKIHLLLAVLIVAVMVVWEIFKVNSLRTHLNGFTHNDQSVVYRMGWVNQYTNHLFYNIYIVVIGMVVAFLLGRLLLLKLKK